MSDQEGCKVAEHGHDAAEYQLFEITQKTERLNHVKDFITKGLEDGDLQPIISKRSRSAIWLKRTSTWSRMRRSGKF